MWCDYRQWLSNEAQVLVPCWNDERTQNGQAANYKRSKEYFQSCVVSSGKGTRIDETYVYISHVLSASSVVDKSSMTDAVATTTDRLSCNSTKIGELSSASSEKHGKPCSTIQKPLVTDDMPCQSTKPKYFLDCGNKSRPFWPS